VIRGIDPLDLPAQSEAKGDVVLFDELETVRLDRRF
jgi:hypothetical protein